MSNSGRPASGEGGSWCVSQSVGTPYEKEEPQRGRQCANDCRPRWGSIYCTSVRTGEHALAREVFRSVGAGMLLLADRGFYGVDLWLMYVAPDKNTNFAMPDRLWCDVLDFVIVEHIGKTYARNSSARFAGLTGFAFIARSVGRRRVGARGSRAYSRRSGVRAAEAARTPN